MNKYMFIAIAWLVLVLSVSGCIVDEKASSIEIGKENLPPESESIRTYLEKEAVKETSKETVPYVNTTSSEEWPNSCMFESFIKIDSADKMYVNLVVTNRREVEINGNALIQYTDGTRGGALDRIHFDVDSQSEIKVKIFLPFFESEGLNKGSIKVSCRFGYEDMPHHQDAWSAARVEFSSTSDQVDAAEEREGKVYRLNERGY